MATPPDGEQPRPRPRNRGRPEMRGGVAIVRRTADPTVEPACRRRRIERDQLPEPDTGRCRVAARVQQDIAKGVVHLPRCRQHLEVIAFGEHAPAAIRNPIDGTREPRADRLHPASERITVGRLDDQVRVIPLQRVVYEPKPRPSATRRERSFDLVDDRDGAQRRNVRTETERDVRRQRPPKRRTRTVSHLRAFALLAAGVFPRPAPPPRRLQRESKLVATIWHLE